MNDLNLNEECYFLHVTDLLDVLAGCLNDINFNTYTHFNKFSVLKMSHLQIQHYIEYFIGSNTAIYVTAVTETKS